MDFLGVAKLIQVMDDHLSIETNGFTMGSPKALRIGDSNPRLCGCFFCADLPTYVSYLLGIG